MSLAHGLALYYFPACGYCRRVMSILAELEVEVELRDVRVEPDFKAELVEARGSATVPVLRISNESGDEWMPESSDIVAYLKSRFGDKQSGDD